MKTSVASTDTTNARSSAWWRDAVIYQIYPRSFADADGDGIGDLCGIVSRIDYLAALGIDAIWLSPFYVSPQADAGYDVADYRDVDPLFGTLADFDDLLAAAHERRLRVIVDLVPNHTSSQHVWFQEALAAPAGSPERERYVFRDGRGQGGAEPPNNWQSVFGGPAWTRVPDGQWYLHLFDPSQPDLNWRNPVVADEFDAILRFWLDRGVDGFRVDVAHGLIKAEGLPDTEHPRGHGEGGGNVGPMWDQDDVHDVYRRWRRVLDGYAGDRILVAEAWVAPAERLTRYVRADEMNQAFNFGYMTQGWNATAMAASIDASLAASRSVGSTTTWVLSNHDVVRHATRFGLADPAAWPQGIGADDPQPDAALGLSRARAATLLTLALPGSAYVYQGEELGLPDHTQLPDDARQDPTFVRTGGAEKGRDGSRIPLPWDSAAPAFGFNGTGSSWLPQPPSYGPLAVDRQDGVPGSTLELYRAALRLRRELALGTGELEWLTVDPTVLDFRTNGIRVIANFGTDDRPLPAHARAILPSDAAAVVDGSLRPDTAVWLLE